MAAAQMNANRDNTLLDLKELKKLVAERCRTWFLDLMVMDDEVRDRTILVKVHCMLYPISNLVVHQVFSELGLVVDVSYISVANGFHYRVCFQDAFSANWALNYFNGRWIFKGSCRFEALMVRDVMNSHVEKTFDEFCKTMHKELPKIGEVGGQTEESVQEGEPKCFKALNQEEEVVQVEIKDAPIVAKESIDPIAHQVFDEMPILFDKRIELVNAFPKEFEVLLDDTLDQEAPALSSYEEKDGSNSKVFEVCKAETNLLDELQMKNGHVRALCFDPGGGLLKLVGDSLDLRCYDKEMTGEIYLCEVCLSSSGTDVNQSTLHASKFDQAKVGILLFDPGGEALVIDGCSQDLGTVLARKSAWKCAHVELSVKSDLFQPYWSGYGAYQSDFLAHTPHNIKVYSELDQLVSNTIDVLQDGVIPSLEEWTETSSCEVAYVQQVMCLIRHTWAKTAAISLTGTGWKLHTSGLVFDPGGGAYMPRTDLYLSRYENLSNYLMHQLGNIVAELDTKVKLFDPGGIKLACVHCVTCVLTGMRDFCYHFGSLTDVGNYALVFRMIYVDKAEFCLVGCGASIENIATLAYKLRINIHLDDTDLLGPKSLTDVNENGKIVIFDLGGNGLISNDHFKCLSNSCELVLLINNSNLGACENFKISHPRIRFGDKLASKFECVMSSSRKAVVMRSWDILWLTEKLFCAIFCVEEVTGALSTSELLAFDIIWADIFLGEKLLQEWPFKGMKSSANGFIAQHLAMHLKGEEQNLNLESLEKLNSDSVAADYAPFIVISNAIFGHVWAVCITEFVAELFGLKRGSTGMLVFDPGGKCSRHNTKIYETS